MSEFKVQTDETGLDLEHMKLALKTLAKLHAMSFAYFNNANVDIKGVSYSETSSYQNWDVNIVKPQFYIQLVFKAPLCITLPISYQQIVSGSLFFTLKKIPNLKKKYFFSKQLFIAYATM